MANTIIILKSILITYVALTISLVPMSKSNPLTTKPTANGFTTDLIHRDSSQSPSYDPSLSPSQRLVNAIRRSFHRIQHLDAKRSQQSPISDITNSDGEYLMRYSIGTPPVPSLGIADTGSDIIWTQCQPCLQCFNQTLPLFNPETSSTYKTIRCNTTNCNYLYEPSCSRERNSCLYSETYGDGSFTEGDLSTDTVTLASDGGKKVISVPNVVIGCGFRNGGIFKGGESGIVGLGGGELSLVRQLGSLAQGKFSYCLVSLSEKSNSSRLNFGANAAVSGRGVVSTPFVRREIDTDYTFYYATFLGISVGNQKLEMSDSIEEGNIIIDSGTTLTILPGDFYAMLKRAMQSTIKLKQIEDPTGALDLCFFTRRDDIQIPDIIVHFKGADLKWKQENAFARTSDVSLCLAAQPAEAVAIYGSLAQTNFLVGYDLEKRILSFKPTHCGRL